MAYMSWWMPKKATFHDGERNWLVGSRLDIYDHLLQVMREQRDARV